MPTSAYLKLNDQENRFRSFVATLNVFIVSGAVLVGIIVFWQPKRPGRTRPQQVIWRGGFIGAGLFLIYAAKTSGVHMMFGYRMFVPVLIPAAMVMGAYLVRWQRTTIGLQSAVQIVLATMVITQGMSVQAISNFGRFGVIQLENSTSRPADYGKFIGMLRQDAKDLKAHWAAQNREGAPKIFLYTGGTGYWLREFYVFEALVSLRKTCAPLTPDILAASDYVQDMNVGANPHIKAAYLSGFTGTPDFQIVSQNTIETHRIWKIGYNYALPRREYALSAKVNDPC